MRLVADVTIYGINQMLVPFPHFHFAMEPCLKVGLPDGFGLALLFTS